MGELKLSRKDEAFVAEVSRLLREPDERRYQDQLDLLLLTGHVDAVPIPKPFPGCPDCDGCGTVCTCHGLPSFMWWPAERRWKPDCLGTPETCKCVTRQRRG